MMPKLKQTITDALASARTFVLTRAPILTTPGGRYVVMMHVLAATACLIVVGQARHIIHLNAERETTYQIIREFRQEQKNIDQIELQIVKLRRQVLRYKIIEYIHRTAPRRPARAIADAILTAADAHQVDPALVAGVVKVESYFNPRARSVTNARGLAQIVKSTAREIGLDWRQAYDIQANVYYGTYYLKRLIDATDNDLRRALRRYNGNYDPNYPDKVLAVYAELVE